MAETATLIFAVVAAVCSVANLVLTVYEIWFSGR